MKTPTPPAEKIDLLTLYKAEYVAPKKPTLITTRPAIYLAICGTGQPGDETFSTQIGALYSVAFTVKMTRKFAGKTDYTVCKLEARWPEISAQDTKRPWKWELLIRTPEFVEPNELVSAAKKLLAKGQPQEVACVQLTPLSEGDCVQMLHVGPYDQEVRTVDAMLAFAKTKGLVSAGPHHEIYLSDPRRVPPARLRTILRIPVKKKD
jgi:hypothetical protein